MNSTIRCGSFRISSPDQEVDVYGEILAAGCVPYEVIGHNKISVTAEIMQQIFMYVNKGYAGMSLSEYLRKLNS